MDNLEYNDLKIQEYLKSNNNISNDKKYLLFKLRTRMTELKINFKNKYVDEICSICYLEEESQIHLMECEILIEKCEALNQNMTVEYEDVFGTLEQQKKAICLFEKIWNTRESLLMKV